MPHQPRRLIVAPAAVGCMRMLAGLRQYRRQIAGRLQLSELSLAERIGGTDPPLVLGAPCPNAGNELEDDQEPPTRRFHVADQLKGVRAPLWQPLEPEVFEKVLGSELDTPVSQVSFTLTRPRLQISSRWATHDWIKDRGDGRLELPVMHSVGLPLQRPVEFSISMSFQNGPHTDCHAGRAHRRFVGQFRSRLAVLAECRERFKA